MYSKYCKLRDERGMNNLQVATAAKIPPSTLYDWEQREKEKPGAKMSVTNLAALAKLFGVKIEYFLGED